MCLSWRNKFRPHRLCGPAPRLGRRGALVLGAFLAVIAALTVFTLVLYALTGDPAEYSLEGDSSGPVDPGFALPGLFEQEEETQETTIRRAQSRGRHPAVH